MSITYFVLNCRHWPRIHIEDPYQVERNLHGVLGEAEEMQLREAFAEGLRVIVGGAVPPGLRPSESPRAIRYGNVQNRGGRFEGSPCVTDHGSLNFNQVYI